MADPDVESHAPVHSVGYRRLMLGLLVAAYPPQCGQRHRLWRAVQGGRAHLVRLRRKRDQPNRHQAVLETTVDALDSPRCPPRVSDPDAGAQRRARRELQTALAGVPTVATHHNYPRFVIRFYLRKSGRANTQTVAPAFGWRTILPACCIAWTWTKPALVATARYCRPSTL